MHLPTAASHALQGSPPPVQDPGWVAWIPGIAFLVLAILTWLVLRRLSR